MRECLTWLAYMSRPCLEGVLRLSGLCKVNSMLYTPNCPQNSIFAQAAPATTLLMIGEGVLNNTQG